MGSSGSEPMTGQGCPYRQMGGIRNDHLSRRIPDRETLHMLYNGNDYGRTGIGLATLS